MPLFDLCAVTSLAAGASIVVSHQLGKIPDVVWPDRATPLKITAYSATTITVNNPSSSTAFSATFTVARHHSLVRGVPSNWTPQAWQGSDASTDSSAAYVVDVTDYGAVPDGSATSWTTTDNYAAFRAALDVCASTGYPLFVPPGEYDIYFTTDLFLVDPTGHGALNINWANAKIIGNGLDRTLVRGKSSKTPRGRFGSIVGNVITPQTPADAANFKVGYGVFYSPNIDGSNPRVFTEGTNPIHAVTGPENLTAVSAGTITTRDGGRYGNVQAGDYIFCHVGFALFNHLYTPAALTTAFNLTFLNISLTTEFYGATQDNNGNNAAAWDSGAYCFNSNPQPMTAGVSVFHRVIAKNCKFYGSYSQMHMGEGGANTRAFCHVIIDECEMYGGTNMVHFGNQPDYNIGRMLIVDKSYLHDTDPNCGSHLLYIHSAANMMISNTWFDAWRAGKYACQHWGSATTAYDSHASWTACHFADRALGYAVLTSEHGTCEFTACTWEGPTCVQFRCNTRVNGGYVRPITGGNALFVNYSDAQYLCELKLVNVQFNLPNVCLSGMGVSCIQVSLPCSITARGCTVTSIDTNQAELNLYVPGNMGQFLAVQAGSTGGKITIDGLRGRLSTAAGVGNIDCIAQITGVDGCAVEMRHIDWIGRGHVSGSIQLSGKTSTDKIDVYDSDISVNSGTAKIFVATGTLPVDVVTTRNLKMHGVGSTFSTRQRLRFCQDTGPDIVSASVLATTVVDPDFGIRRIIAAAPVTIDTFSLAGSTSWIAYDLTGFELLFADANATVSNAGNVEIGRVAARGRARFTYDTTASKLIVG